MQSNNQPPKEEKIIITYPKRPNRDPDKDRSYRKAKVLCNLKQINLGLESTKVTQYAIHYEPIISDDNYPLKRKLIRELRKDLNGYFVKLEILFLYLEKILKKKFLWKPKLMKFYIKLLLIKHLM